MNRLLPDHQSAYRQGHSTETALLKILSDILDAAQVTLLGLLDLSATFDTVDHDILLTRLKSRTVLVEYHLHRFHHLSKVDSNWSLSTVINRHGSN